MLQFLILIILLPGLVQAQKSRIWHVKAIHPDGYILDIKALDKQGNRYDVKCIEENNNFQLMDIKALIQDERADVKVLESEDSFLPVKAIDKNGNIYDIKAIDKDGNLIDVKGLAQNGNIIQIKAVLSNTEYYAIKAISPEGAIHDIKGVKVKETPVEDVIHGIPIRAHIKALPQTNPGTGEYVWNVKAILHNGQFVDVKAVDTRNHRYDIKAFEVGGNVHFMDVRAIVNGRRVPVKILTNHKLAAILPNGRTMELKAILPDGTQLDVMGINRTGNIIQVKAIQTEGNYYGVKAISPGGSLHDIKGIKMHKEDVEGEVNGISIYAHVKALPQVPHLIIEEL